MKEVTLTLTRSHTLRQKRKQSSNAVTELKRPVGHFLGEQILPDGSYKQNSIDF